MDGCFLGFGKAIFFLQGYRKNKKHAFVSIFYFSLCPPIIYVVFNIIHVYLFKKDSPLFSPRFQKFRLRRRSLQNFHSYVRR